MPSCCISCLEAFGRFTAGGRVSVPLVSKLELEPDGTDDEGKDDDEDEGEDDEEDEDDDVHDRTRLVDSNSVGGSDEIRTFVRGGSVDDGVLRSRFRLFWPSMALMLKTGVAGTYSSSVAIGIIGFKGGAFGVSNMPFSRSMTCMEA